MFLLIKIFIVWFSFSCLWIIDMKFWHFHWRRERIGKEIKLVVIDNHGSGASLIFIKKFLIDLAMSTIQGYYMWHLDSEFFFILLFFFFMSVTKIRTSHLLGLIRKQRSSSFLFWDFGPCNCHRIANYLADTCCICICNGQPQKKKCICNGYN